MHTRQSWATGAVHLSADKWDTPLNPEYTTFQQKNALCLQLRPPYQEDQDALTKKTVCISQIQLQACAIYCICRPTTKVHSVHKLGRVPNRCDLPMFRFASSHNTCVMCNDKRSRMQLGVQINALYWLYIATHNRTPVPYLCYVLRGSGSGCPVCDSACARHSKRFACPDDCAVFSISARGW